LLVGAPLALAVVLFWHPAGGPDIYEDVRADVEAWLFVHTVLLLFMPLLGIAAYVLGRGLTGVAATVSRVALVFFLVFYTAYEVTIGLGTGVLVDYANGLPATEQAAVADAIQELNGNPILGDPLSVSLVLGVLGWVVAMVALAVATRRGGAGWATTLLIGVAAAFAVHPPPVGPIGLACFAVAAVLMERRRSESIARPREPAAEPAATAG
jgi:hypothetical protein